MFACGEKFKEVFKKANEKLQKLKNG